MYLIISTAISFESTHIKGRKLRERERERGCYFARAWHACATVADGDIGLYAYFIHCMHFLLDGFYECCGFVLCLSPYLWVWTNAVVYYFTAMYARKVFVFCFPLWGWPWETVIMRLPIEKSSFGFFSVCNENTESHRLTSRQYVENWYFCGCLLGQWESNGTACLYCWWIGTMHTNSGSDPTASYWCVIQLGLALSRWPLHGFNTL